MIVCHRPSLMNVFVLRPFIARFSICTFPALKCCPSISPQPVSGLLSASFEAIVESPARNMVTVFVCAYAPFAAARIRRMRIISFIQRSASPFENIFPPVKTVFDDRGFEVFPINRNGLQQDRGDIDLPVVDRPIGGDDFSLRER